MAGKRLGILPSRDMAAVKRGSLFKKSLIIVLIITCLPAGLIGISFYFIGTAQIETEVNRTHRIQLEKARKRMDEQLAHIELTVSQWSFNPLFDQKLKTADLYKQFLTTQELYNSLSIIKGSSTLIDQVYLYLDDQEQLISEDEGIKRLPQEQTALYRTLLREKRTILWTKVPNKKNTPALSLVHALSGGGQSSYAAIVIMLDGDKVNDMVRELTADKEGSSFLFKETGEWITTGVNGAYAPDDLELFLRDRVSEHGVGSDSFIVRWKQENYSVSYGRLSQEGSTWIYVTASPVNHLIAPVLLMSRMILAVSGLGLAAAVLLAWFGSERLYRPIRHLVKIVRGTGQGQEKQSTLLDEISFIENQWEHLIHQSHFLQDRIEEQMPVLRDGFLLQLVQGHLYSYKEQELRERMSRFGWNAEQRSFSIAVVRLTGFFNVQGKFAEKDKQLITYAAANIIEELSGKTADFSAVINFQDLTIGLLLAYPVEKGRKPFKSDLFKLADEITATLNTLLKLQVIIGIGKSTELVSAIPTALQEVKQMLQYRDLEQYNQILDMDEIAPHKSDAAYYPFQIDKELQLAIRHGDSEEADEQIVRFMKCLSHHGVNEFTFRQSVYYLLGSMLQTMIHMGFNPHQIYNGENLYEQLLQKREQDEIRRWLQEIVVGPFAREYSESQDSHLKQLIKQTMDIIETRYMDDISLEYCANELGVHPVRLSKAFKSTAGSTFIDYLTKVRIGKSKELLHTTDWKIHDIARMVGYQPTYFNKIFRKQEGVSASEYRSLTRG